MRPVSEVNPSDSNKSKAYFYGIINGTLFRAAMALIGPSTVLPLFLATLTDQNWLIGLGAAINFGGWFIPQVFGAKFITRYPYRLPWYRIMGVLRVLCLGFISVFIIILGGKHPTLLLACFFALFIAYSITGGLAGISFLDIVGKSIPARASVGNPGRGSFFGWRIFLGGALAVIMGYLVVNPVMANLSYPYNFAALFGIATALIALGVIAFSLVIESPSDTNPEAVTMIRHLGQSFRLVRDDIVFRRYYITRSLLMLWSLGLPFYILFAEAKYELTPFWVGTFISARFIGEMLFNFLWARLSDRGANRIVLQGSAFISLIPPLICGFELLFGMPRIAFTLTFLLSGATVSGMMLGGNNYLLQHAPQEKRPQYIGVTNTTLGIIMLSAGLGGLIIDLFGFPQLFGLVFIIGLLTSLASIRLDPTSQ